MKKSFKFALLAMLIIALTLTIGCSAATSTQKSVPSVATAPRGVPAPAPMPPNVSYDSAAESASGGSGDIMPATSDRKIIRTGQITLEVADIGKSMEGVATIATDLGGYVVSSNRYGNDEKSSGRVSIRIPANRFYEAFTRLRNIAIKVPNESTNSQDITQEYTDLKTRLSNLEATEAQYLTLLQKAQTVEEILKVQKEISNVRGQIEQTKGRILYYDRTTDLSLIEVMLQQTQTVRTNGWNPLDTFKSAINGLIDFGKVLVDILIWIVILIPVWVIIWVIVFLIRRHYRKKLSA